MLAYTSYQVQKQSFQMTRVL